MMELKKQTTKPANNTLSLLNICVGEQRTIISHATHLLFNLEHNMHIYQWDVYQLKVCLEGNSTAKTRFYANAHNGKSVLASLKPYSRDYK